VTSYLRACCDYKIKAWCVQLYAIGVKSVAFDYSVFTDIESRHTTVML